LLVFSELEDYLEENNIRYAEFFFTPSIPWKYDCDAREILEALLERTSEVEKQKGVTIRWILDNVRQFGREPAERTAQLGVDFREHGVVAIGLGGDEQSVPLKEFAEVFTWARAHQLFLHVHAGEIGEPREIWDALQVLGANRIGHGIQAARDAKLMEYLREHAIGLDVCLTSNTKTRAWPLLSDHPFQLLFQRGVPVTLNTDDPGLFETTLVDEYAKAAGCFELTRNDLEKVALQGIHSSFLPYSRKMEMMEEFQASFQASE
jgi:aminodeoxyfutalosine deaminase